MNDGQYETPPTDPAKPRVAPRVVLASAGVVVATLFATVAALTSGPEDRATPAGRNPLEDVVSKSSLPSAPTLTSTSVPAGTEVEALSSTSAATTTTTPRRTRVTTVTRPDGTTTTTTVDDTTPEEPVQPPVYTTTTTTTVVVPPTTTPVTTTTEGTTTPPTSETTTPTT
ncbi:hypothetical protein [Umezawaea sp.]|uniref:hypothetical protein n=1 Tax=Umezawaea sp. TaxID=1955258 RepID=UPI002ED1C731